jgi:Caspase domain
MWGKTSDSPSAKPTQPKQLVPVEVEALLSKLSLSQYGPKLVSELGGTSIMANTHIKETELEGIGMKPGERRLLLNTLNPGNPSPTPVLPQPQPVFIVLPHGQVPAPAPGHVPSPEPPLGKGPGITVRALVIGVDDYTSALGKLENAVSDARAVCNALAKLPGASVSVLTNCTKAEMDQRLKDFRDSTGVCAGRGMKVTAAHAPAEGGGERVVGIVFFAGHGLQVNGKNYLVPADFKVPTKNANLDVMLRDTAEACVALEKIEQVLADAGIFAGCVFLDCCRNVPDFLAELGAHRAVGKRALPSGMADCKASNENMLVAFATSPGNCALDRSSRLPDHSPFTAALLRVMDAPCRLNDLGMYLVDEVKRDTNNAQHPQKVDNFGVDAGTAVLG